MAKSLRTSMPCQADANYQRRREEMQAANIKLLELLDLPPDQRMKEILKLSPEDQHFIANRAHGPKSDALMGGMDGKQKETLLSLNNPEQVVVDELTAGQAAARHLQRTPARRSHDRLLVQPLQRFYQQRSRPLSC
jgi:hypothetical protein